MSILFGNRNNTGASQRKLSLWQKLIGLVLANIRQWLSALGEIWRDPIPSALTIAVLGVSLTLPATMHVVVKNAQVVEQHWQNAAEISLFLNDGLSSKQLTAFVKQVELNSKVESVELITKNQALTEFENLSGFGDAIKYLDVNPLPNVLIVRPQTDHANARAASLLLESLEQSREVNFGKLDIEWLRRLNAILDMVKDAMSSLTILLFASVVLIVGNTIRLSILSRKEEIEVLKLVGATNSFIHRPFLFTGLWYGLFGGTLAWLTIEVMVYYLSGSINQITSLYQSNFSLTGLSPSEMLVLLLISMTLGLLGSYLVVRKQIKLIEPDAN
ncbi:permease-like cell division protein FtsX [Catenovulum maritimum]|uniref:Cell division protein FtsX n=1 Tax=Catenovulum maritimum TaxID=1513271 RepID=A0A0J8GRF5_9ALTE|nr:permease-like cell division protein FtsX [Catenovulum maritimum]KMT63854.1 cell division protein FtsX [Catenovulum maritimum]